MVRLKHDSGSSTVLKSAQILGPLSPLEFDDDGYAELDDEGLASSVVALHPHVERARDNNESDDVDAEAFVDRVPQDDVIADIESGEYDAHLNAIEAAETDGKDRIGVQQAIEERRD